MKGFIFNSGRGSRLGTLTHNNPKALVPLNSKETILSRQLRLLSKYGLREFIITTGYLDNLICDAVQPFVKRGLHIEFVYNPQFASSNAIVSMYLARNLLRDDTFFILHGDLVFDEAWVEKAFKSEFDNFAAIDASTTLNAKDFKARIRNGYISEVNVDIFEQDCVNLMPFYKMSPVALEIWMHQVKLFCENGQSNIYAEIAANEVWNEMRVHGVSYSPYVLLEVDTPEDLEYAKIRIE